MHGGLRIALAAALLGLATSGVRAQITVEPQSLSVTVPQHETATHTVTLRNAGSEPLSFCLSFDRPLQREGSALRLSEQAGGTACGEYGEVLHYFDEDILGGGWDPGDIEMTPEGRLFTAEVSGPHRTFEFTPDLQLLRSFVHPHIAELEPFPGTVGVGYDTASGTLWWMNTENRVIGGQVVTLRVLLLEGDLDGVATGRRIEIAPPEGPIDEFVPGGLSYEPATDRFFFMARNGGIETRKLWAVDRAGTLAEGYPFRPEPYPPPALIGAPYVHGGAEGGPEGVRIEYTVYPTASVPGFDRVAVVDRWGNSEGQELETPVPAVLFEANGPGAGTALRSRVDPNGVMYMTFRSFEHTGIVGVRPHPLPPSWLVVGSDAGPEAAWDGTLAPGESREIILTFRAGARAVGAYTSALQAFDAATGEAVEGSLVLTVTQGTDAEGEAEPEAVSSLAVYPNPSSGVASVVLTVREAGPVTVAVYDVLGREVTVLHDGPLAAGEHRLALDEAGLPSGVYLVRVTGMGFEEAHRVTLVR